MGLITLNRARQLNVISSRVVCLMFDLNYQGSLVLARGSASKLFLLLPYKVSLLAEYLEKWEKDDKVELILIKVSISYILLNFR